MRFAAIDVETANSDMGSICQIGVAQFDGGRLVGEWRTLIDPEDYFDDVNISIHGIHPRMVKGQPTLPEVEGALRGFLENSVTVCHTHFDRVAIARAFSKYEIRPLMTTWLDSACVVRRTWKDLATGGYGLANVSARIGYEFNHHDALEDAKAAGFVLLAAMKETQLDLDGWLKRVKQPIFPAQASNGAAVCRDGNPEGYLYGEVLVFTGALEMPRNESANLAASLGCSVANGVTKKTTILVVGDQDVCKLAGYAKSSKHRRAEELVAAGYPIKIITESDFKVLAESRTG